MVNKGLVADQAGALMGPQSARTDQTGISPGQGLLQGDSITISTKLCGTALCRCKPAIKADGQHQPNRGALTLQSGGQTAATDSKAAGMRSN